MPQTRGFLAANSYVSSPLPAAGCTRSPRGTAAAPGRSPPPRTPATTCRWRRCKGTLAAPPGSGRSATGCTSTPSGSQSTPTRSQSPGKAARMHTPRILSLVITKL
eukprot:9503289-Pyramimonas_sp.AAC.2